MKSFRGWTDNADIIKMNLKNVEGSEVDTSKKFYSVNCVAEPNIVRPRL